MNKKKKVILSISSALIFLIIALFINGLYLMSIEDYYGDNQEFYYKSKQNDIIINRTKNETGQIMKTWTRIYAIFNKDTVDFNKLLESNKIEIVRLIHQNENQYRYNIILIDSLLQTGNGKIIIKN